MLNLIVALGNESIPTVGKNIMSTISNAYSFISLFLIGLGIAQTRNYSSIRHKSRARIVSSHRRSFFIGLLLITGKLVLSPFLYHWIVLTLSQDDTSINDSTVASVACFYGALPSSGFAFIMANRYNVNPRTIGITTIICLVVSIPLLFCISIIFENPSTTSNYVNAATYLGYDSHLASMGCLVIFFCGYTIFQCKLYISILVHNVYLFLCLVNKIVLLCFIVLFEWFLFDC